MNIRARDYVYMSLQNSFATLRVTDLEPILTGGRMEGESGERYPPEGVGMRLAFLVYSILIYLILTHHVHNTFQHREVQHINADHYLLRLAELKEIHTLPTSLFFSILSPARLCNERHSSGIMSGKGYDSWNFTASIISTIFLVPLLYAWTRTFSLH